ncbi:MAG: MBL fold metallo-hydrolase [Ignavibacteriales bacterium]|nr:MBL fold metallo-hydrolase [Ignavibacteriales bacterium]
MLKGPLTTVEFAKGDHLVTCVVNDETWKQNAYIIASIPSGGKTVIDPGGNAERMIQCILEGNGALNRILLTHAHFDHVGAASQLSEHFGVACELHKNDIRLLMHAPMYALRFANKTIPAVTFFKAFDEQGESAESSAVRAIHTPGHTQGSTCYLFDGFVFTGDTILFEHVGRTDLPGGDSTMIGQSIDRLLENLDEDTTIFPGHGKPWSVREAKAWWNKVKDTPPTI